MAAPLRILECLSTDRLASEGPGDAAILTTLLDRATRDGEQTLEWFRAIPGSIEIDPALAARPNSVGLRRISWDPNAPRWFGGRERRRLLQACGREQFDLVWLRGSQTWRFGLAAAAESGATAVVEIGSAAEAARARRRAWRSPPEVILAVASAALRSHLRGARWEGMPSTESIVVLPPAMLAPDAPAAAPPRSTPASPSPTPQGDSPHPQQRCVVMLAGAEGYVGRGHRAAIAAIEELPRRLEGTTAPLLLVEDRLGVHPAIERRLARHPMPVVRIPSIAHCRAMLSAADAILVPEPLGRPEPGLIEAAYRGTTVIATEDPAAEWIESGAFTIPDRRRRTAWTEALRAVLHPHPAEAQRLAALRRSSRDTLAEWLDPAPRLAAMLGLLGGPLRFPASATTSATASTAPA